MNVTNKSPSLAVLYSVDGTECDDDVVLARWNRRHRMGLPEFATWASFYSWNGVIAGELLDFVCRPKLHFYEQSGFAHGTVDRSEGLYRLGVLYRVRIWQHVVVNVDLDWTRFVRKSADFLSKFAICLPIHGFLQHVNVTQRLK